MGLDVSHGCWNGSYSSFNRFRRAVAVTVGLHLDAMDGFSGNTPGVKWEALKPDPVHVLLRHSDCDGEIAHSDCKPLADRLLELAPLIEDDPDPAVRGNWRDSAIQFAEGLMRAHESGESVEFA